VKLKAGELFDTDKADGISAIYNLGHFRMSGRDGQWGERGDSHLFRPGKANSRESDRRTKNKDDKIRAVIELKPTTSFLPRQPGVGQKLYADRVTIWPMDTAL
jgi:hypothetical protein